MERVLEKRNLTFDFCRAICIIYIVAFWHLQNYFPLVDFSNEITKKITTGVLTSFAFLSGLFLGKKDIPPLTFYFNRFKRFYILFFFSVIPLFFNFDLKSILFLIFGLGSFKNPPVPTLWYMSMLVMFYALVPFICYNFLKHRKNDFNTKLLIIVLLNISLYLYSIFFYIDKRILLLFIFFCLGLITSFQFLKKMFGSQRCFAKISNNLLLFLLSICFLGGCILNHIKSDFLFSLFFLVFLISISEYLKLLNIKILNYVVTQIVYASLCAYLYHRVIYKIFKFLFLEETSNIMWYGPIMVFLCFIISFYIQYLYDIVLKKILVCLKSE